jgi:hypothetical protein
MLTRIRYLLVSGLMLVVASALHAVVMVSSLAFTPGPGSDAVSATNWLANKFTTNNSSPTFTLDSITIQMIAATNSSGNFHVAIYSDASGIPGSQVGSLLTGNTSPASAGQYTWTASGITLNANSSYWMVQEVTSGAGIYSPQYETVTPVVVSTWTLTGNYIYSANSGTSWVNPLHDGPSLYSISATAVPEPAYAALLLAVPAMAQAIRRHRYSRG